MIEVMNLSKSFGEITALKDISFQVGKGQIVGFLGANGAGKTTTMDIICGCIGADQGFVKVCGVDVTEDPQGAKSKIGYLPDEPPLYVDMKVREYISFSAKLRNLKGATLNSRVDETIEKLELKDVQHRLVGNLSKGYKQRVGLAQAIVHDPEVLILDEPTEGLDPNQIYHIRELIKGLAGKHTILLSSHILSEVQNTCDHIVIIHQGRVVEQGSYEQIVKSATKTKQYILRVQNPSSALAEHLQKIVGVRAARTLANEPGKFEVEIADDESVLDQVARTVIDGKHGLRELSASRKSLEEVFYQLTH